MMIDVNKDDEEKYDEESYEGGYNETKTLSKMDLLRLMKATASTVMMMMTTTTTMSKGE